MSAQPFRVSVRTNEPQTFVWELGRTADPSATLGMTKGWAALPCSLLNRRWTEAERRIGEPLVGNTLNGSVTHPFVIPSVAEVSAVRLSSHTNVCGSLVLTQPGRAGIDGR